MSTVSRLLVTTCLAAAVCSCSSHPSPPAWESANPLRDLPEPPLGILSTYDELPEPPSPERVRLGRWLFYDTRLSADGTVSCATCHRPEHGFSEPTAVSTGIDQQQGARKSPSLVNLAWTIYPNFFWDGRADSLEAQAPGPMENPIEMGNTLGDMTRELSRIDGYAQYFAEAFGDPEITVDRVAKAIADYERTLMSGNSPWDRWRQNRDENTVSDQVKLGHELFFGKAACNQCHLNQNVTDSRFHNIGVGWDPETQSFDDLGRFVVSGEESDRGAFKTPTLRDVTRHAPYMHDGSMYTLRETVEHYNVGGTVNPFLSQLIFPLGLLEEEIDALVAFMEALESDDQIEQAPASFPR